jgi:hypothetical protein
MAAPIRSNSFAAPWSASVVGAIALAARQRKVVCLVAPAIEAEVPDLSARLGVHFQLAHPTFKAAVHRTYWRLVRKVLNLPNTDA